MKRLIIVAAAIAMSVSAFASNVTWSATAAGRDGVTSGYTYYLVNGANYATAADAVSALMDDTATTGGNTWYTKGGLYSKTTQKVTLSGVTGRAMTGGGAADLSGKSVKVYTILLDGSAGKDGTAKNYASLGDSPLTKAVSANGLLTVNLSDLSSSTTWNPLPTKEPCTDCITFSADKAFGMKMWKKGTPAAPSLEYSTDQLTWKAVTVDTGYDAKPDGDTYKIHFRGTGNKKLSESAVKYYAFTNTADSAATAIACSGNVMTLLDYATVAKGEEPTMENYAFCYLFRGFAALTSAPELPATNLALFCYYRIFMSCTSLTAAPALPATTLAASCYNGMFQGCTSLTAAPALPATTLELGCYDGMFKGCTSLTAAPALPATTLVYTCYSQMFNGCTSLVVNAAAPGKEWKLAATPGTGVTSWGNNMFTGTGGTLTETPDLNTTYYVRSAVAVVEPAEVTGASTVKVYTNGTVEVAGTPYVVEPNAAVTVTYTADAGYEFAGGKATWTTNFTANAATIAVTIPAGEQPAKAVAEVGGTKYGTYTEAFAAAANGGTVKILSSATETPAKAFELLMKGDVTVTADEPVTATIAPLTHTSTIDNDGMAYIRSVSAAARKTLTIGENVTLVFPEAATAPGALYVGYSLETPADIVVNGRLEAYLPYVGSCSTLTVNPSGSILSASQDLIVRWGAKVEINGTDADWTLAKPQADFGYVDMQGGSVVLTNTFVDAGDWLNMYTRNSGKAPTLELYNTALTTDGSLTFKDAGVSVKMDATSRITCGSIDNKGKITVDVAGATGESITLVSCSGTANYGTVETTGEGAYAVTTSGNDLVLVKAAAKVGDVYYATLKAAVGAATEGQTVELLASASGDGIMIYKSVTVDFGGFTYTVNGNPVGMVGMEAQGFQLGPNTVVFTNGTITSTSGSGVKTLVQNYANLTLADMILDGANLDGMSNAYTLSTNNGSTEIIDSTIKARNTGDFAFDVCCWSPYTDNAVTLTSGTITGDIELSSYNGLTPTLALNGGTISGKLVMGCDADKVVVTKSEDFEADAPAGYYWREDTTLAKGECVALEGGLSAGGKAGDWTVWGAGELTKAQADALKEKGITNLVIGTGVTGVGAKAFEGWRSLRGVTVGAACAAVGAKAFHKCYNVTNVTCAAAGVTVGDYAFLRCNSLQSLAFAGMPTWGETPFAFHAGISMDGGMPDVYAVPQVTVGGYKQVLRGSADLATWYDVTTEQQKKDYNFFKIELRAE